MAGCELYPYPLPDLFCGLPLVVAGKYSGAWPAGGITLNGTLPGGTRELPGRGGGRSGVEEGRGRRVREGHGGSSVTALGCGAGRMASWPRA